jgi:translation initiation factor 1A
LRFPPSVRVNETDTFDEERGENDDFFDFDDVAEI